MNRGAVYSADRTLRFTLTREWAEGPRACYIGHNPSTAGHEIDDPTSLAWVHFAKANGFGGYTAVNLYPFRSPDPKACHRWAQFEQNGPDWAARDALIQNESVVVDVAKRADIVVAAWGALAIDCNWIEHLIEAIQGGAEPWPDLYCLGRTRAGDPKHVMARGKHRIPRDQRFEVWMKSA